MIFNLDDLVTRKSYNNDIVFKVIKIENDIAYLKGVEVRLLADAQITDLVLYKEEIRDDFDVEIIETDSGHDAFNKKKGNINDISSYKNSLNFIKSVKVARKFEKSHDKLVIIAGACQSDYEELIKAGANYASSPKRVNIHALDPAIIATTVAVTERNKQIDLINLLNKTKYGKDGMGGIIGNGLMYVGFPR